MKEIIMKGNGRQQLMLLLSVSLLLFLALFAIDGFQIGTSPDSAGYFAAGEVFASGGIDYFRTPVFPLVCKVAVAIAGNSAPYAVAIINLIFFIASVVFLHRTTSILSPRPVIQFVATASYCWNLAIISWLSEDIGTESLAISFVVMFCYYLTQLIKRNISLQNIAALAVLSVVLILLRPFFVCFTPIIAIALVYALFRAKNASMRIASIVAGIAIASSIFGYCHLFQSHYGFASFSYVSSINRASILRGMGKMQLDTTWVITPYRINPQSADSPIYDKYDWGADSSYLEISDKAFKENFKEYAVLRSKAIKDTFPLYFPDFGFLKSSKFMAIFNVPLLYVYLFIAIFATVFGYRWIKLRENAMLEFLLASMCAATIFTTLWGSSAEYQRLMLPMFPCLPVMFTELGELIMKHYKISKIKS